jgi:hypothetical protein
MTEEAEVEQIELKAGDKSLSLKSVSLNTIITLACAAGLIYIGTVLTSHAANEKLVIEILEKIEGRARVSNCLNSFPEAERTGKAEWCKRFAE